MAPSIESLAVDVELARRAYRNALDMPCDQQDGEDDRTCLFMARHHPPQQSGDMGHLALPDWPEPEFCPRCVLAHERKRELKLYRARFDRHVRQLAAGKVFGPGPLVLAEGATKRKSWIVAGGRKGQLWIRLASPAGADHPFLASPFAGVGWGWAALDLWSDGQAWHWRSSEGETNARALVLKTELARVQLAKGLAWQIVRPNAVIEVES